MKVGDLITAYEKGYFRLTRIERRFYTQQDIYFRPSENLILGQEYSPLYYYKQEYDSNGNPRKSEEKCCDAQFCEPAKKSIKKEIEQMEQKIQNLKKLL